MIIYLAGPKFSLAERAFSDMLACSLKRTLSSSDTVLQQSQTADLDGDRLKSSQHICKQVIDCIDRSDAVVAILDGGDADAGTCVELGYAKGKGKLIVGVRTDFRQCEDRGLNLMVSNVCSHLIVKTCNTGTIDELASEIAAYLTNRS